MARSRCDVHLATFVGIWFGAVLRADNDRIVIGMGSNVPDNCVSDTVRISVYPLKGFADVGQIITCRHLCVAVLANKARLVPLNIRNDDVNRLAEKLARRTRVSKTEAVRTALENELRRLDEMLPLRDRLRPLQRRINARPSTGQEADKAFYDDINGST